MTRNPWKQTLAGGQDEAKSLGGWWLADYGASMVRRKKMAPTIKSTY
jgi:hypothetical protein